MSSEDRMGEIIGRRRRVKHKFESMWCLRGYLIPWWAHWHWPKEKSSENKVSKWTTQSAAPPNSNWSAPNQNKNSEWLSIEKCWSISWAEKLLRWKRKGESMKDSLQNLLQNFLFQPLINVQHFHRAANGTGRRRLWLVVVVEHFGGGWLVCWNALLLCRIIGRCHFLFGMSAGHYIRQSRLLFGATSFTCNAPIPPETIDESLNFKRLKIRSHPRVGKIMFFSTKKRFKRLNRFKHFETRFKVEDALNSS